MASFMYFAFASCLALGHSYSCDEPSNEIPWYHVGPGGYYQKDDQLKLSSSGAAQAAVMVGNTSWLVATTNGGIWKTDDVLAKPGPRWSQVLDGQPVACTSISAMESKGQFIIAGCGAATSSEMSQDWNTANTGDWGGVMVSRDGGKSWTMTNFPANYFVTAFVVHSPSSFLVAARSHFYNREDGGVWVTKNGGNTFERSLNLPVYDLAYDLTSKFLFAALPWSSSGATVWVSRSGGDQRDFVPMATNIDLEGRVAFYLQFALGKSTLFVGALTVSPQNLSNTSSVIYYLRLKDVSPGGGAWKRLHGGPDQLDQDAMPKDRMALLVNPLNESMLFVAGNADALVYRVHWPTGTWTTSSGKGDTSDGSAPHPDCRRYFWEPASQSVILLTDGGAFLREQPGRPGGKWRSLAGNIGAMEFLSADWDPIGKRWVGGAQDNCVQVAPLGATSSSVATGVIFGDGTVSAVDTMSKPPRLWGATQFLGNVADSDAPKRAGLGAKDDMDRCGFGFYQENIGFSCVPLFKWFKVSQFQYFVQSFALHANDPTKIFFYARSTIPHDADPGSIYTLDVPYSMNDTNDLNSPKAVAGLQTHNIQVILAGGTTDGKADPSVLVALNTTHLLHRSSKSSGKIMVRELPQEFAEPVQFEYLNDEQFILGPVSHGKTISLAVSPANSSLVAVTGWDTLDNNYGTEKVWFSDSAGESFIDITYNLRRATGVIGQVRPSALLFVPIDKTTAIVVGTSAGAFFTFTNSKTWTRLGSCDSLPFVPVAGLSYENVSDTLVAATFGRGVYVVHGVTGLLNTIHRPSPESSPFPSWAIVLIIVGGIILLLIGVVVGMKIKKKRGRSVVNAEAERSLNQAGPF